MNTRTVTTRSAEKPPKQDVYTRITAKIVASLEEGVRPWIRPWSAENAAGRITRPLRHNGMPYSGINILMLWASAIEQGFASPIWMTFKQARRTRRPRPQGREGFTGRVRQHDHEDRAGRPMPATTSSAISIS